MKHEIVHEMLLPAASLFVARRVFLYDLNLERRIIDKVVSAVKNDVPIFRIRGHIDAFLRKQRRDPVRYVELRRLHPNTVFPLFFVENAVDRHKIIGRGIKRAVIRIFIIRTGQLGSQDVLSSFPAQAAAARQHDNARMANIHFFMIILLLICPKLLFRKSCIYCRCKNSKR